MYKLMIASIAVTLFAACTTIETPKNMALFNGTNLDNWVVENDGQFSGRSIASMPDSRPTHFVHPSDRDGEGMH